MGVMSGTSLDAVDTVLVSIDNNRIDLLASYTHPFPDELRSRILAISTGQGTTLPEVGLIDHTLGKLYATAVLELLKNSAQQPDQVTAIGNHGQTVYHQPDGDTPFSMQLGDANLIAALTGINTIADFRRFDIALGGQGAPLTPAFHQFLFQQSNTTSVVVNIGGIANITVVPSVNQHDLQVIGFDTGPGNMLMDSWCEQHIGEKFDRDARWAQQGQVNQALLDTFLTDPYLAVLPPKSTGREHYNIKWLETHLNTQNAAIAPEDTQRTLCEFTAVTIAESIQKIIQDNEYQLVLCGGGAKNPLLVQRLQYHLKGCEVLQSTDHGIPEDCMEAMAFAWLARQRVHGQTSNMPSVTGASGKASMGVFYPAMNEKCDNE